MRGSHVLLLAVAGLGLLGAWQSAQATVIYQDTLTGSGDLNGSAVQTSSGTQGGTAGALWVTSTNPTWVRTASGASVDSGDMAAYLPFTPESGHVYTLQVTENADNLMFGFTTNEDVKPGTGPIPGGSTVYAEGQGTNNYAINNSFTPFSSQPVMNQLTVTILLDTTAAQWTTTLSETDPTNPSNTYTSGPQNITATINSVGFENKTSANHLFTDFSLTTAPVPEPASLGLLGLGMMGLLARSKRRR